MAAVTKIPNIKNGDWFHNGKEVLPVVLETIDDLKEDLRNSDQVTGVILEMMVKSMLDVPDVRPTAKALHVHATRILHRPSIIGSPMVDSSQGSQTLPTTSSAAAGAAISGPDSGRLTQNEHTILGSRPPADQTAATTSRPSAPDVESQPGQRIQNGNSSNLNLPIPNKSSTGSVSGSTRPANRSPSPSGAPLTITASNSRPSPSRRPSKGPSRPELPKLDVDVAERWIQDRKAGRHRDLQGKYLLERLETRDHVSIYLSPIFAFSHGI